MNRGILTRLERAERLVMQTAFSPAVSLIYPSGGTWRLDFGLSGAKPGSGRTLNSEHSSMDAARLAYDALCQKYGDSGTLIICDI